MASTYRPTIFAAVIYRLFGDSFFFVMFGASKSRRSKLLCFSNVEHVFAVVIIYMTFVGVESYLVHHTKLHRRDGRHARMPRCIRTCFVSTRCVVPCEQFLFLTALNKSSAFSLKTLHLNTGKTALFVTILFPCSLCPQTLVGSIFCSCNNASNTVR